MTLPSCSNSPVQSENNSPAEEQNDQPDEPVIELMPSKFADFFSAVVPAKTPAEATYYLEKAITVNGVTTSTITAAKNGVVLMISEVGGVKTVTVLKPESLTTIDVVNRTFTVTQQDEETYNAVLDSLECAKKYSGIEFTPSAYTVVDKDQYAEIAIINDTPHIFIFDDNYILKYIVYAQADGALVTEELFTFTSEVDNDMFVIPADYTQI